MASRIHRGIAFGVAVFMLAAAGQALADPRSKWRIEFDHSSEGAGQIVLRIAPLNGEPIDVTTQIPEKTHENQAADLVRDSLRAALGKAYKVQTDDGEAVLIRKNGKTPKFELTLASSTVTGLSVKIERD